MMRSLAVLLVVVVAVGVVACKERETAAPPPKSPPSAASPSDAAAAAPVPAQAEEAATAAYEAKDWPRCAELFTQLATRAKGQRQQLVAYNAACCHALDGKPDAAFAALEVTVKAGFNDVAHLESDPDLTSVRADPRWAGIVSRVRDYEKNLGAPELRRELLALVEEDQIARTAWIANMDDAQARTRVEASDKKTTARMKAVVAKHGWPGRSLIGYDGANAAWLLAQHADADPAFQRDCLAKMEPMVATGEASGENFAYLYDRVAVADKRPQRYGTQFTDKGVPSPIEDEAHVDERRAAVGMSTLAEYAKGIHEMYGEPKGSAAGSADTK